MEFLQTPYSYELPTERIAQRPVYPPDAAKLLVVERESKSLSSRRFSDLPSLLGDGDLLVFNNTRVIPARLFMTREQGNIPVEVLLLREKSPHLWSCFARPLKKLSQGDKLLYSSTLIGEVVRKEGDEVEILFRSGNVETSTKQALSEAGVMPIPPYIRSGKGDATDSKDYQTIFAEIEGSVAAPTASLHFTEGLIDQLKSRGCKISFVTLHVGSPSFKPLRRNGEEGISLPGAEKVIIDSSSVDTIVSHKKNGGRVVAVGTTAVRALESIGEKKEISDDTTLFIQPSHKFRIVDSIITNFHQPNTTHLLLVEAFIGKELLSSSYDYALQNDYRFLSYGDGMILR